MDTTTHKNCIRSSSGDNLLPGDIAHCMYNPQGVFQDNKLNSSTKMVGCIDSCEVLLVINKVDVYELGCRKWVLVMCSQQQVLGWLPAYVVQKIA